MSAEPGSRIGKLLPLLTTVAASLIGQTTVIRLRHPIYENAAGHAYFDTLGVKSIDLLIEGRSDEDVFLTYLHEVGHFIFGHVPEFSRPPEIEKMFLEKGPLLKMTEEEEKAHLIEEDELQVETFAHEINRLSKDRALCLFGTDDIEARLRVLIRTVLKKEVSHE